MTPAIQPLRAFLEASSISSTLERDGFRRFALTWNRRQNGIAHVVDFQMSRFSDPGSVTFTVNLGTAVEEVWRVYYGHGFTSRINEADCFPHFRVGEIISGFRRDPADLWWSFSEKVTVDDLAAEVKSCLFDRCLPVLYSLNSLDAIFHFVLKEAPPRLPHPFTRIMWAIVCHLHGDISRAESQFAELSSNARLSAEWRTRIAEVRQRLGSIAT